MATYLITIPSLERHRLLTALRALARQRCNRRNCGTACLCDPCCARRALPYVQDAQKQETPDAHP